MAAVLWASPVSGMLPGGFRLVWLQYCGPHQVQERFLEGLDWFGCSTVGLTSSPGPGKLPGGFRLVWLQYCGPHQVQVGLAAVLWAYVKPSGTWLVKRAADTST